MTPSGPAMRMPHWIPQNDSDSGQPKGSEHCKRGGSARRSASTQRLGLKAEQAMRGRGGGEAACQTLCFATDLHGKGDDAR